MTDKIDTSPEAVNLMASQLNVAGLDEDEAKLTSEAAVVLRALSARVAEYEVRFRELEERYLAVVGDKINLRGEVATLEARLAKAEKSLQQTAKMEQKGGKSAGLRVTIMGQIARAALAEIQTETKD